MKMLVFFFFITTFVGFVSADLGFGRCVDIDGVTPFNVTEILGRWYLYEENEIIAIFGVCTTFNFQRSSNTSSRVVLTISNGISGQYVTTVCKLDQIGQSSKFNQQGLFQLSSPFFVLGTDYQTYMVIYVCYDIFGVAHDKNILVLTRQRHPSDDVIRNAENAILLRGLENPRYFFKINQNVCSA
ncbi:hypothetical protein AMK59_1628 [Oryctes borbonicus]|uniref:Lipocalin/cytosolic fatty-acid binding domain-containing protein n=1 Tax=Oryctes borbonicus TaxID=1629725 RepID=A0A0T6BH87_9SCAR|nr:hypothetical protein AMK59_1628 [Oryctes borbonicus]